MTPDDMCLACDAEANETGFCGAHLPVPFCPICGGDGRVAHPGDRGASACPCTTRGPQSIARRVNAWCALQGVTLAEAARLIGVNRITMTRWLNGASSLRGGVSGRGVGNTAPITRLAELLGVTEAELEGTTPWTLGPWPAPRDDG